MENTKIKTYLKYVYFTLFLYLPEKNISNKN